MKKLNTLDWVKIILVAVVLIFACVYIFKNNASNTAKKSGNGIPTSTISTSTSKSNTVITPKTSIKNTSGAGTVNVTSKCNFKVTYPPIYSKVGVPLTVSGVINLADTSEGCMWGESYSRAGDAEIFYNKNGAGWMPSGTSVPVMASTGNSSTTLDFSAMFNLNVIALGLPSGTPLKIVFTELNLMNKPNPQTFEYEVYLK